MNLPLKKRAVKKLMKKAALSVLLFSLLINPIVTFAQTAPPEVKEVPKVNAPIPNKDAKPFTESMLPFTVSDFSNKNSNSNAAAVKATPSNYTSVQNSQTKVANSPKSKMAASSLSVGGGAQGQTSVSRQNASSGGVIDPISSAQNGGLGYNFTFNIPPGRSGMTPSLNLSYSSQSFDDSGFGYGWALSTPYIQRYNKSGFDNLYSTSSPSTDFYSSLSGEIVPSGSLNGYIARNDDGSNLQYTFASNAWSVIDKNGTTYQYGPTSASQQTDSGGSGKIFKWMLQKMTDSNGNSVTYSYTKDLGQIYPSGITYTDTATTTGVFAVNFTLGLEATSTATSSAVGFPVKNRYQVNQITVLTNGTTTRTFTLTFGPGDNGSRTILKGITETGQSLTGSLALPPTSFSYSTSSPAFATSTNITLGATTQINGNDRGVAFADFNGDSVPDIIEAREQRASDGVTVLVNDKVAYVRLGDGSATTSTSYTPPCAFTWDNGTIPPTIPIQDAGGRLVDVNGDGLLDFICPTGGYINNGSNWVASSTWNSPVAMTTVDIGGNNVDAGVRFGDVNGDGLIDIIQGVVLSGTYTDKVYINNTHGWTYDPIWSLPTHLKFTGDSGKDGGGRLIDVNGDGLADIYFGSDDSYTATSSVYTNTGHGWTYDPAWILPDNLTATTTGMQFADLNKDGLIDLSIATGTLPYNAPDFSTITWTDNRVYLNTGSGWKRDLTRSIPIPYSVTVGTTTTDTSPRFGNFLNHGLNDLIVSTVFNNSNFYSVVEGVQGNMPDLLNKITESAGNSTSITYQSTSAYKASGTLNFLNPKLPYAFPTVFQITHNDGVSSPYTEWYGYNGGTLYYASTTDHRFGGFASIIKYVGGGDPTIIYFHTGVGTSTSLGEYQDNQAKIGQIYRVETYGAGATSTPLYKVVINKWDSFTRGLGNFAWPVRTTELDYDAKSTHKDIAQEFSYSTTTGNLTQNIDWGEVTAAYDGSFTDVGTDKISAAITYAASSTLPITKPSQVTTTDQSGTTVGGTKYLYDNLAPSLLTKGNLTERDDLKTAPNAFIQSVRSTYNPLGLVTQSIDSRGATTTYSYDPYNLYPATTTNALGHITTATYNYSLGSAAQIIDPNGAITKTLYDPVDRILAILRPDVNATTTLATSTAYIYIDTGMPRLIHETDYLDATNIVNKYIYRDGFSRVIEQRTQAEGTNNYKVEDSYYNFLGLVSSKSLPFLASSVAYTGTSSPPASYLMSYYYYDPLKRIIQSSTYVNYVLHNYGNWVDSTTDTLGKVKDFYTDAYGNLSKVVEHMGTTTATTTYTYDAEKDLTKVTDALGNIRNFTYDTLGRLLKSEDLHSISDTTFGSTTYAYDDNGNITNTVSPRGKSVTYTYDLLNRVNTEDSPDTAYTDVIYTYDTSLHAGKGRLGNVSTAYVSTGYDYDWNGNLLAERHAIPGSATTTTFYYYDRQQNPTYVIYPDNSEVYYGYNTAGLLDYVLDLEAGTTTWRTLVSNFDYSPMDQVTQTQYGNGTASTNTYIPSNLYWLGSRVAYNSIKYFQYQTYGHDNQGDVTSAQESASVNSAKIVYYTYDDLYRLASASSTGAVNGLNFKQTYSYDLLGNLTSNTGTSYLYQGDTGTNYANPDAATSIGGITNTYDQDGNLLTSSNLTNTWDYKDRLASTVATVGTSSYSTAYSYDQSGNRLVKVVSSTPNVYTYYANKYYATSTNGVSERYVYANNQLLTTIESVGSTTKFYWSYPDPLKGTDVVTDNSGNVVQLLDYYPFGSLRLNEASTTFDEQRKYIGEYYDSQSALSYLNARYYDSNRSQFLSEDPIFLSVTPKSQNLTNPQSLNTYSYGNDSPVNYSDPNGLFVLGTGLIQKGDTLSSIARQINAHYGTNYSVSQLAVMNHISNPNYIQAGAYLTQYIPTSKSSGGGGGGGGTSNQVNNSGGSSSNSSGNSSGNNSGKTSVALPSIVTNYSSGYSRPETIRISQKISEQMSVRGWDEELLIKTILKPFKTGTSIDRTSTPEVPATAYFKSPNGYTVVNEAGEVVQVSNLNDPTWIPDYDIQFGGDVILY